MIRVIIAGSRDFINYAVLRTTLNSIFGELPDVTIISGTARGTDQLGERWATEHSLPIEKYPTKWNTYGRSTGYRRNEEMAKVATHCVVFWDGKSRGANHMINIARRYKLNIRVINFNGTLIQEIQN